MRPRNPTEDDLKRFEANRRTIKRARGAGPVSAAADGQGVGHARTVSAVTPSPYKSKLEASYAGYLELQRKAGLIKDWRYEPMSFKLDHQSRRFRPDFLVQYPDGLEKRLEFHEVKGRWIKNMRDGKTHLAWVAQRYPMFTWILVERDGHGWVERGY